MDGAELRRRREQLGMTQAELARALGVYQATISQWEGGRRGIRHGRVLALALQTVARERGRSPVPVAHAGVRINGAALYGRRGAAGMTQQELGRRAGVRSETISRLESGARRHVYPVTLARLAAALGCDGEALTDDDG